MTRRPTGTAKPVRTFLKREDGAMTSFGLFMLVGTLAIGGLAIDVSHAFQIRTRLQIAADGAAHAAIVKINEYGATERNAKDDALAVIERALPATLHGMIIDENDIVFGEWDDVNGGFTEVAGSKDAVMVDLRRAKDRQNAVGTFLLNLVGRQTFDVYRQSIAYSYAPSCLEEGYIANTISGVSSGNTFESGFCIHGNEYVSMSSGNRFEEGTIVSMPDRRDLDIPSSGLVTNWGLEEALRDGYYDIDAEGRTNGMISVLSDPTSSLYPSYLYQPADIVDLIARTALGEETVITGVTLNANNRVVIDRRDGIDTTNWIPGFVHTVSCSGNQKVMIPGSTILRSGVLVTNCKIEFGQDAAVEDVIMVTTNRTDASIDGASGFRMGVDDSCAPGGGASFYTLGGVKFPASFKIHGSRIIAAGPVQFSADAGGVEGVLVLSDESISATSGGSAGFCGVDGLPPWYELRYYRTVY